MDVGGREGRKMRERREEEGNSELQKEATVKTGHGTIGKVV